jgi:hypothetical protein
VTVITAYLVGLATVLLLWRVFDAFVRKPVERPLHRWVIVAEDRPAEKPEEPEPADDEPGEAESAAAVESDQREPAA